MRKIIKETFQTTDLKHFETEKSDRGRRGMNSFFYCPKCAWSLEPGAACKPECPECGARLHIGGSQKESPDNDQSERIPQDHGE
jgi:transcription initiation factor IIE alpha subunit